jgi:peptidoglycan/LPS O-acetylase OafA/YrhL
MKYRAEIDGLRALAVIPVILYHTGFKLFGGGYVGVDVFFVISGYLITTIILAELEAGTFSLTRFYERRARRILPALFVVMFACLPFAWFWLLPNAMRGFSSSLVAVPTFLSNIYFWRQSGYFDTATELKPLIHTWSLAVEEQYYVLFPLFLMLTWKLGKRWIVGFLVLVFGISLAGAQLLSVMHPTFAFYMLPTRGWELLIGAFIAFYYSRHNIKKHNDTIEQLGSLFGLLLIVYSVFAYNDKTPFPSIYTLVPTLGAALIIIFATHKTVVGQLLGLKPLVAIGLISYSAYLWHQPIFAFARERSFDEPSTYLMSVLALLSFALAYLSWKYIERPFRNKHRISQRKVFAYGALCSALFVGIGFYVRLYIVPNYQWDKYVRTHTCYLSDDDYKLNEEKCVLKSTLQKRSVLLWGDSNAAAQYPGLIELSENNSFVLSQLTQSSCPPLSDIHPISFRSAENCNQLNEQILDIVSRNHFQVIILHSRWIAPQFPISLSELESKANLLIDKIKVVSPSTKIILIGQSPEWLNGSDKAFIESKPLSEDHKSPKIATALISPSVNEVLFKVSSMQKITYIDPIEFLCVDKNIVDDRAKCIVSTDGSNYLAYVDSNHMSNSGSKFFFDKIKHLILPIISEP